jgi:serine O-acetyltransferase
MIFHQVTLAGAVTLGGHVDVGAGAKLIGPLTVGDHVVIGANAVVTKDIPSNVTVAGIPAKII